MLCMLCGTGFNPWHLQEQVHLTFRNVSVHSDGLKKGCAKKVGQEEGIEKMALWFASTNLVHRKRHEKAEMVSRDKGLRIVVFLQ